MKAYSIVGYSFEADLHCVACTQKRHAERPFDMAPSLNKDLDECGIPETAEDNEGNPVHAIFAIDAAADSCGDCGESLL